MDETDKLRCADFLSIGLESLESGNEEIAAGFIKDVRDELSDEGYDELSDSLQAALDCIDEKPAESRKTVESVYTEMLK